MGQFDCELNRAKEMKKNHVDKDKLVVSLTTAQEKAMEKINVLEMANQVLTSQGDELEASFAQAERMLAQRIAELEKARAELARFEGE